MRLKIILLTFESTKKFKGDGVSIRRFFGQKFSEYTLLHHHSDNKLIYQYPLVQYKMIDSKPILIGINQGAKVLNEISDKFDTITLDYKKYEIVELNMTIMKNEEFGLSDKIQTYEFVTPWLPLNQEKYPEFLNTKSNDEKADILRRGLIGNLISMSKTLNYTVPDTIRCDVDLKNREERFKNKDFISFYGGFMVNFSIPDYLGIGRSVSKGYGTVRKWYGPPDMY